MKKVFLFLLIALIAFACGNGAMAQDRTVSITMPSGDTYYNYTGSAADTLGPVDQDTLDIVFKVRIDEYIQKIAVKVRFDPINGNDTTCNISLFGKEFEDDGTYVSIIGATLSGDVNAANTVKVLTSDPYTLEAAAIYAVAAGDSTISAHNHTPFDIAYRYYRLRFIHIGTASGAGDGILIDDVEIKFYTD